MGKTYPKCNRTYAQEIKKVMFISAERFMYHFIKSIKSNEMIKFKDYFKYRCIIDR